MAKYIVLLFVFLAILPNIVSAQTPEQAPSGVTGICLFDGHGGVYCPEMGVYVAHGGVFNPHLPATSDAALPASRSLFAHRRFGGQGA